MIEDDGFFDYSDPDKEVEIDDGKVYAGDDINITEKHPGMHRLLFGLGWDFNNFDGESIDLDASLFMVNKDGETRIDEDFIFYNNLMALDGAVKHHGDSRTGAGEGDDEAISVDLHGIPFDIVRIEVVVSVYQGEEKEHYLGLLRKVYFRIMNEENAHEILRFEIQDELKESTKTCVIVGYLDREGPKWHFKPVIEFVDEGLKKYAKSKGLVIIDQ